MVHCERQQGNLAHTIDQTKHLNQAWGISVYDANTAGLYTDT